MDLFNNIDPQTLLWLTVICGLLCGALVVASLFFQVVGSIFGLIGGLLEMLTGILTGGPASWCGCIVLIFGCGGLGAMAIFLFNVTQTCGTPQQVNFCRLLGY